MTTSTLIRAFGLSRMALGLWLALAPQRPGELWFGEPDPPASGTALLRCVGGRDLGIGLGLTANATPDSLWLRVGILADVIDGVATLAASRQMPRAGALVGFLGATAYSVIGILMLRAGRDRTADRSGIAQG
ncbi:hypothetical protein ACKUUI_05085 [Mycobacterium seoulense]|uniref:hypothetical protein n=1 Tax=Mycobacterium seoulense TaxID=386911 RepID=UPI003CE76692